MWKINKYYVLTIGLCLLYIVTRLVHLTVLPIFTDEAIYIRWSQIGSQDANWRFISLVDGKQPLFTWIMMILLKLIHGDPLFVGRLVSVIAGFFTMIGLWLVTYELFRNKIVAFITTFLYVFCPFSVMYDKLALYDSLVSTLSIWNLYLAIKLAKSPRLDLALLLGMSLGMGMLNKSSGFISMYLLPTTFLVFNWKDFGKKIFWKWISLLCLSAILSQVYYGVLRLSPLFHMISEKNTVFLYTFSEWKSLNIIQILLGNIHGLFEWMVQYITMPIFIAAIVPLLAIFSKVREKLLLLLWWICPLIGLACFGKVLYPRFILFMAMPLLPMASLSIWWIYIRWGKRIIGIVLLIIILFQALLLSFRIIANPVQANIPLADRGQMIDDWPAGGGVREINTYLANQSTKSPITVYTDGTFGLMPYAIEIYLVNNPQIEIHGIWPFPKKIPPEVIEKAKIKPTFVVLNQTMQKSPLWPMDLIAEYHKGNSLDRTLRLYQVNLQELIPSQLENDSL